MPTKIQHFDKNKELLDRYLAAKFTKAQESEVPCPNRAMLHYNNAWNDVGHHAIRQECTFYP